MLYKVKKGYMFIALFWDSGNKSCMICENGFIYSNSFSVDSSVNDCTTKFLFFKEQELIFYKGEFFTLKHEYHEFIQQIA